MGFKELMQTAAGSATDLVKKEMEKRELDKQQQLRMASHTTASIIIKNGNIGVNGECIMRQRPEDNLIYFNGDENALFEFIGYEWNGPTYATATKSQSTGKSSSETVKKGKSGKMAAGALIGSLLMPGVGTVVGAAIGAGSKGKSSTNSNSTSSTEQFTQQMELPGTAILRFRKITDNTICSVIIECNTAIDSQIRCFQINETPSSADVSADIMESLKGIKALKELLDMGVITNEEFELKKKQMLNL